MFTFGLLMLLLSVSVPDVQSLSCIPCGLHPCQDPKCCDSGFYTTDACGCCAKCAQGKGQQCGGIFQAEECAKGLRCLRTCRCFTESGSQCVLPFEFEGTTYTSCTTAKSENGKSWCATEVHPGNNSAVFGKWEDCSGPCECEDLQFQGEGRCVEDDQADSLIQLFRQAGDSKASLDDDFSSSQKSIKGCPRVRSPADLQDFCKCSPKPLVRDLQGNVKGGCLPPSNGGTGGRFPGEESGYCFLENIVDPANPSSSCFSDVEWSAADGQFYSFQACLDN